MKLQPRDRANRVITWLAAAILCVLAGRASAQESVTADREALVALYNATGGENWDDNENWLSEEPLEDWYGVTVGDGRVTELVLRSNQLTGIIPPELGDLSGLELLDLSRNELTGTIPPELGKLSSLTELVLHNNRLTGPIPSELGNLSSLRQLDLARNRLYSHESLSLEGGLTGPIPPELGNLANLGVLNLADNQLAGPIPPELGKLSSLRRLDLARNRLYSHETLSFEGGLTGPIPPELGNLANLGVLDLADNQLTGPIPPELGDLSRLRELDLSFNQLTGTIPAELSNLSNLTELRLGINLRYSLETGTFVGGLAGAIPTELGNLPNLRRLDLRLNRLTGPIPPELGDLANLSVLNLANNQLTGPIPTELGNLASLTRLDLDANQLTDPIPTELANLSNLKVLVLGRNRLTGPIPKELATLSNLTRLVLFRNRLTGPIPTELATLSNLTTLHLASNRLTGPIPTELATLSNLWWLGLSGNRLTGPIPPELGDLSRLGELRLSGNRLTGLIPTELASLSNLFRLWLDSNQLTGPIPPELGNLSRLADLGLSDNRLTGTIPPELGNLSNLWRLGLAGNRLTGTIPPELGNLSNLTWLDLARNRLAGTIPPELGNLSNLQALSLSNNQLTGVVPQSFTTLTLEHFYFHGNAGLSVPDDVALLEWLAGIKELRGPDYSPSTPFVPVILSAAGRSDSFFTSELTLTNRGTAVAMLDFTYTAHRGGGSGVASVGIGISPGQQLIVPNAIDFLISRSIPIPDTGNRVGTLRITLQPFSSSQVGVTVRTTTTVPEGRAGLAYSAVATEAGFDEAVYLCGLRQNAQDRSNVALQNIGTATAGPITLRTTVFSGEPEDAHPRFLEDVELEPGGFYQYSGLLGVLDSVGGSRQGYVRVERVEGTAPFYAYGVINDQANSDGSFVFPVAARSLDGKTGQTLPVIVETGDFTSELMMTNFSEAPKTVMFRLKAEAIQTPDKTATVEWSLQPGQQVIVPNVVDTLRKLGVAGVGRSGQTLAGALFATVAEGDMSGIVIGARTSSSDGRGGQYGVFYNAVPDGDGFRESAWVEALQQNEENRSNLALVNTGEIDDSPSVFQLDIYNGASGMLANTVTGLRVAAGGWRQINGILGDYAPGIRQGYVRIIRISGNNPFLAYGVINDGGAPGQRSGDGAYLPARE